jgi:AraC-like DNA-binding protein
LIRYFAVPPTAQGLCGIGYAFRAGAAPLVVQVPALMPQLQLIVQGGLRQELGAGGGGANAALTLVGATHAASTVAIAPGSRFYGLSLVPAGWETVARVGADEVADTMVEGAALWGERGPRVLAERAGAAASDEAAMALLFEFVVACAAGRAGDSRRHAGIAGWIGRAGLATVDELTAMLDLSPRQAARVTARAYGASPKRLLVKYRALRLAAVAALRPEAPWFEAGYEPGDGFYDQSHLVHDFKRFVGVTPSAYARERGAFAREMLRLRWRAGAREALTLWS